MIVWNRTPFRKGVRAGAPRAGTQDSRESEVKTYYSEIMVSGSGAPWAALEGGDPMAYAPGGVDGKDYSEITLTQR